MRFTYPDKFTYLNIFVMKLAQKCSDNGGPTVLALPVAPQSSQFFKDNVQYMVTTVSPKISI